MKNAIPYPLRATRIDISLNPFGFWLIPHFFWRKHLTEIAKQQGETIWYFRWAWIQVSYARWV